MLNWAEKKTMTELYILFGADLLYNVHVLFNQMTYENKHF